MKMKILNAAMAEYMPPPAIVVRKNIASSAEKHRGMERPLAEASAALTNIALLPTTKAAGFDSGLFGFELGDFLVGKHTPNNGTNLVHSVTVLTGTDYACPGLTLNYSIEREFTFGTHVWTWESPPATAAFSFNFHWQHSGDHRKFRSKAAVRVIVCDNITSIHSGITLGVFSKQGDIGITVDIGQTIRIEVEGRTFDRAFFGRMSGELELRPIVR
ncbi:MAG: hypothetical protein ACI88A_003169 [Paraglaciecola sp.]|jgi:hypothetical protein